MFRAIRYVVICLALVLISVVAQAQTIDINTATATQLETLKGIGPGKAAAIVKYRTEHGAFQSVDDLVKVPGIGSKTLGDIKDKVSVGGTAGTTGLPKAPATTLPAPATKTPAIPPTPATKP